MTWLGYAVGAVIIIGGLLILAAATLGRDGAHHTAERKQLDEQAAGRDFLGGDHPTAPAWPYTHAYDDKPQADTLYGEPCPYCTPREDCHRHKPLPYRRPI